MFPIFRFLPNFLILEGFIYLPNFLIFGIGDPRGSSGILGDPVLEKEFQRIPLGTEIPRGGDLGDPRGSSGIPENRTKNTKKMEIKWTEIGAGREIFKPEF